jgi:hypothetical protein
LPDKFIDTRFHPRLKAASRVHCASPIEQPFWLLIPPPGSWPSVSRSIAPGGPSVPSHWALGHIAVGRKHRILSVRADQMLKKLKAARLDQTFNLEQRKLLRGDLLIVDDLALQALDQTETQDFYEIVVERHQVSSTIVTSNREPGEWLDVMADPMLAQSAVNRL